MKKYLLFDNDGVLVETEHKIGINKFGASKEQCLVIEDSPRGLTSAYNAEIECAIVDNEFTLTHDFSKATYRISKITELPKLLKSLN